MRSGENWNATLKCGKKRGAEEATCTGTLAAMK